jgi:hypothetical protein
MRNTDGIGAGGRCRCRRRRGELRMIPLKRSNKTWRTRQSRRRTRPMNRSASRTPRPELPASQADPSRTLRSKGARADFWSFRQMALPGRRARARESTASCRDHSAKRPGGCSRPGRSRACRTPGPQRAQLPRSPTAPDVGNGRASSCDGRPVKVARAHRNSPQGTAQCKKHVE